jgi:hypothetical protein
MSNEGNIKERKETDQIFFEIVVRNRNLDKFVEKYLSSDVGLIEKILKIKEYIAQLFQLFSEYISCEPLVEIILRFSG